MTHFISYIETAKLIRSVLKESFPQTRFTVRSQNYNIGSYLSITYRDGPTHQQVKALIKPFEKYYGDEFGRPRPYTLLDVHPVHFGVDSIRVQREFSFERLEKAVHTVCHTYNIPAHNVIVGLIPPETTAHILSCPKVLADGHRYLSDLILREANRHSWEETQPSPTAQRVQCLKNEGPTNH